jgi:DNA-binding MarR family transcriptional regulator
MTPSRSITALDRVLELVLLLNEDMTSSLARDGLTPSRAHLLWEIGSRGPSTQRVLAQALGVSARNVTGLVDGLVATGFVTREAHPTDRRATLVSFTEHGADITARMADGQQELATLLFADLAPDRLDCLVEGLTDVLERLKSRLAQDHG